MYHLAQLNIAHLKAPMDHPSISGFTNNLDRINAIAESSPGFIWRLKDEENNNATSINPYNNDLIIVNLSVWASVEDLKNYAYHSEHVEIFKNRALWFHKMDTPHMCLWWIKAGQVPTALEAKQRLDHLTEKGESPYAFGFRKIYAPPT